MEIEDPNKKYHKKTILQVVPALVSGGVERGTIEIAKYLKASNYNSIVISAGGPLVEILNKHDIVHIKLNVNSKNPFIIWRNSKLIGKIIQKYNVDLIHARSRAPAWSCYIAAKSNNKKFITTFHGIYSISNFLKKYYNSIMTEGLKIIAVSNFVKQHIIDNYNADESKIEVIHRGVDHNSFDPAKKDEVKLAKFKEKYNVPKKLPIILLPSRMSSWKGHLILIEALHKIKHLDFYCIIVGDLSKHPNFTQRVGERIAQLKLQSKIQIFGNETDMLGLYCLADIVLSTSTQPEAFGRTIIEGQAMEKLVIATNIGGAAETINDKVTGFHVKVGDSSDLADKLSYCLSILGTDKQQEIGSAARASAIKNFSLNSMLSKTIKIYEEVFSNKTNK